MTYSQGANVVPGGWVGDDSRVASVATCIELCRHLVDVNSTWIIKQSNHLFSLNAILKACFKDRPVCQWVACHENRDW